MRVFFSFPPASHGLVRSLMPFVVCMIFVPETKDRDVYAYD